jgi:hypothetical protein
MLYRSFVRSFNNERKSSRSTLQQD